MTNDQPQAAGAAAAERWQMRVEYPAEGTVLVRLSGRWKMEDRLPAVSEVQRQIETGRAVMAGRSGAAFAAQIGSMQANEEVDALTTMGLSPMELLVLPRMVALVLMMPLLTLYTDLLGILGGGFVGITIRDRKERIGTCFSI